MKKNHGDGGVRGTSLVMLPQHTPPLPCYYPPYTNGMGGIDTSPSSYPVHKGKRGRGGVKSDPPPANPRTGGGRGVTRVW